MKLKNKLMMTIAGAAILACGITEGFEIKKAPIMTKWASDVDVNAPLPEYPRPQLERKDWLNLNGVWEFQPYCDYCEIASGKKLKREILVPFAVESALSGVMEYHDKILYRRGFKVPEAWAGKRVRLNFDAVDYEAEVFVNGKSFGVHKGGYLPFSYDITDALKAGENELLVKVFDPTDKGGQPRGKQDTKPQGIMYTPTSGIWKTVWLEPVSKSYVSDLKITPDIDAEKVTVRAASSDAQAQVKIKVLSADGKKVVASASGKANEDISIPLKNATLWSPENPYLYNLAVDLSSGGKIQDSVKSYFGMRKISVGEENGVKKFFLNNKPVFLVGPLDQGYWPDGILTAPTDEALRYDIEITKKMGFNFIRKHIKIEPARWYYWADKLGVMVWQDAPSCNSYNGHHAHKPEIDKEAFESNLVGMVDFLKNSPSVITWVIFNEGQGQFDTERLVEVVRKLDSTRLINEASGGGLTGHGDILDIHHYPAPKCPKANGRQILVCGEFGGIGLVVPGHMWVDKGNWGYTTVSNSDSLLNKYAQFFDMVRNMKNNEGLAGVVYTQTTDVMIENNGLLTYDRVLKVEPEKIAKINNFEFEPPSYKSILPTSEKENQVWKYTFEQPKGNPFAADYDDSKWLEGEAPFGKVAAKYKGKTLWDGKSIWMRKKFKVGDLTKEQLEKLAFRLFHDENIDIFINGVRAFARGGYLTDYEEFPIEEAARKAIKPNSENVIAVQCRNFEGGQMVDVGIVLPEPIKFKK